MLATAREGFSRRGKDTNAPRVTTMRRSDTQVDDRRHEDCTDCSMPDTLRFVPRKDAICMLPTSIESDREAPTDLLRENAPGLESVVSRYLPMFYKRAFWYLGNAADAEDAVQDALLPLAKHREQFRGQAQLSTWLTAIVICLANAATQSPKNLLVPRSRVWGRRTGAIGAII
jgi:hypothetical protein